MRPVERNPAGFDVPPSLRTATTRRNTGSGWRVALGLTCLAVYGLPLFAPPPAVPLSPPPLDAGMLTRLFPTVPGWWVVARLIALAVGAVVLAWKLDLPRPNSPAPAMDAHGQRLVPAAARLALAMAAAQLLGSLFVEQLGRRGQALYLIALFLPGAILWLSDRPARSIVVAPPPGSRRWQAVAVGVVVTWLAWVSFSVRDNPIAATPVDTWQNVQAVTKAIEEDRNLLLTADQPTMNDLHILLLGADLFHPGTPPSLWQLQGAGLVWVALAALWTAWGTGRLVSWRLAPLASAMVLYSPITLGLVHWPYPFVMGLAGPAALMLLLVQIYQTRSRAALLFLAPTAGLNLTQGYVAFYSAPALLTALWLATRRPRFPTIVMVAAGLSFLAATVPAIRTVDTARFRAEVSGSLWPWWGVETYLFDQRAPMDLETQRKLQTSGWSGPFDIAISGLLGPFAIPRTSLRLWGDAVLEPVSAALTLTGLLLCLRRARRQPWLAWAVAAWVFVQLPVALTTSYDRISPLRNLALPVASAPFAAMALQALCAALGPTARRRAIAVGMTVLCATSGTVLFAWVQPRILATAAMELVFEATTAGLPAGGVAVLEIPRIVHPRIAEMTAFFRPPPLPRIDYRARESLFPPGRPGEAAAEVFFWSPGLEEECRISRALCGLWPEAVLYTLHSRSRLTQAYAASPRAGGTWRPEALGPQRWSANSCADFRSPFTAEPRERWCTPRSHTELRGVPPSTDRQDP